MTVLQNLHISIVTFHIMSSWNVTSLNKRSRQLVRNVEQKVDTYMDLIKQPGDVLHEAGRFKGDAELLALLPGAISARDHTCALRHIPWPYLHSQRHPLHFSR